MKLNGPMFVTTRDKRVGSKHVNRGKPVDGLPSNLGDISRLLRYKLPGNAGRNKAKCVEFPELLYHLTLATTPSHSIYLRADVSAAPYLDLLRAEGKYEAGEKMAPADAEAEREVAGPRSTIPR
jgi:hypothetical protein